LINFSTIAPNTVAGKIVRWPLRLVPRNTIVPVLQGPLRGKKWIAGASLHRCWLGSYEPEFQRILANELKAGGVFYDVGANVGFYSLLAAGLIFPGQVYAFEPLTENISYIRAHLDLNRIRNATIFEMAISDSRGQEPFSVERTRAMGRLSSGGERMIRTYSLDTIIQEELAQPPTYIKMDIEGAELRALLGAQKCFARYKPTLFLATHGKRIQEECCRLLLDWNYHYVFIDKHEEERAELLARPSDHGVYC
jgi:FkbM family methyltransferase